jgi:hypothetical protein
MVGTGGQAPVQGAGERRRGTASRQQLALIGIALALVVLGALWPWAGRPPTAWHESGADLEARPDPLAAAYDSGFEIAASGDLDRVAVLAAGASEGDEASVITVFGRIVAAETGDPLAGVTVRLSHHDPAALPTPWRASDPVITAADGRYRLWFDPAPDTGFGSAFVRGAEGVDLVLEAAHGCA